jgi:DNA-binding GntR family transcriptional regulator
LQKLHGALNHTSLGEQVYNRIATGLLNGEMRPNDKLTIRGLAEQLGVSTTPIRDAVNQLTHEQVLEQRSSKDVRVPVMTRADYLEILDIRLLLEGLAAERAAERATPAEHRALRNLLISSDRATARGDAALATQFNQEFHLALSSVADMPNLQRSLRGLWLRMGPVVAGYYDTSTADLSTLHYAVLTAIERGDPATARKAIQADIVSAKAQLLDQIDALNAFHTGVVAAQ